MEISRFYLAHNVDDLSWGVKDGYEHILQPILQHYALEDKVENGPTYRFCGREIVQLLDFWIKVSCTANIIKILPINFDSRGRKDTDSATDGEKSQLQSVVGSLGFTTRMSQLWFQYDVSRLQSITKCANISQLKYCNDILSEAKEQAELGLYYKASAFNWNELIILSFGDASWAGDEKIVEDKVFPRRSQYGRITILANPEMWDGELGHGYYIASKSGLIHRVCQSTMRA